MRYTENLNPISKYDDVGNNMLDEMRREAESHYRESKKSEYEKIVEEGFGCEEIWEEWEESDEDIDSFIKQLRIREGCFLLLLKDD